MFNIEFNHFFKEYILPILNNPLHGQMQLIMCFSLIRSIEVPCTKAIGHEFKSENQPLQKKKNRGDAFYRSHLLDPENKVGSLCKYI